MPCHVDGRNWLEMTAVQYPFMLVGTATIEYIDTDTPVLGNLYVHPDLRRLGIATELVWAAKAWCRQCGKQLYLHVMAANYGAVKLYEAEGFVRTGEVSDIGSDFMMWEEVPGA